MIKFFDDPVGLTIKVINENYSNVNIKIIKSSKSNASVSINFLKGVDSDNNDIIKGAVVVFPSTISLFNAREHIMSVASQIILNKIDSDSDAFKKQCREIFDLYMEEANNNIINETKKARR